jgi:hypothetical protein
MYISIRTRPIVSSIQKSEGAMIAFGVYHLVYECAEPHSDIGANEMHEAEADDWRLIAQCLHEQYSSILLSRLKLRFFFVSLLLISYIVDSQYAKKTTRVFRPINKTGSTLALVPRKKNRVWHIVKMRRTTNVHP